MERQPKHAIERANRMFAIEQAVKLSPQEEVSTVDQAREIFNFLQETHIPEHQSTGFQIEG